MRVEQVVEAVLFASDAPLRADEIARADEGLDEDRVEAAIQHLRQLYLESERAFEVVEVAGGYQLLTRPEYAGYLERFDTIPRPSRLSGPALESLAIIAYRQPIGRLEVEYIRGVSSAGVIRTLQDRGLVDVVGRSEAMGRPLLYGTTARFLEHFGFESLAALPRPEELPVVLRDRDLAILPDDAPVDPDQEELPLDGPPEPPEAGSDVGAAGHAAATTSEAAATAYRAAPDAETPGGAATSDDAGAAEPAAPDPATPPTTDAP
jgi:segregation and condensation protein B